MAKVRVTLQDARAAAVAVLKNIGWDDQGKGILSASNCDCACVNYAQWKLGMYSITVSNPADNKNYPTIELVNFCVLEHANSNWDV